MSVKGIYGLSGSGIDVDSMVKVGMLSKQNEYDRMYKKEVKNEWMKEAYANVYSELSTFTNSTMSNYKMSYTTNPMSATSTSSTVATATANADAASMAHTVEVSSVASNAYLLTKDTVHRNNESAQKSIYLKDVIFTKEQIADISSRIDKTGEGSIKGSDIAVSFDIADGVGSDHTSKTVSFTYDDIFSSDETLNDLVSKINNAGVNLKASYDSTNDAFSIYQKDSGKDNQIILSVPSIAGSDADKNAATLLNNLELQKVINTTTEKGVTSTREDLGTFAENASSNGVLTSTSSLGATADEAKAVALYTLTGANSAADVTSNIEFTLGNGTKSATFSYSKDELKAGKTVNDLLTDINAKADTTGVTASISDDGRLVLTSSDNTTEVTLTQSKSSSSTVKTASNAFIDKLMGSTSTLNAQGKDAAVKIDGKDYTSSSSKITVANVTYSLAAAGSATVSVAQDTDKLIENVKQFVSDYNKMIDSLNSKYNETQYSDYSVLTKSQENAMTQEQIDKWNEKAKSGLLYHDKTIRSIVSAMREAIYTPVKSVDSSYNTMMSIGIESSTDQGHLRLDEDKLKKALAADPDCVRQIFANSGDVTTTKNGKTTTTTDYNQEGVVNRIYDKLNESMKKMKTYSGTSSQSDDGSTLGNLIKELQTKMSNFKTMMAAYEKALYNKYDAMETSISRLSSQYNFVSGG